MMDCVAFLQGRAGTVALQNVNGLPDDHVTVIAPNIMVPSPCKYIFAILAMSQATAGSLTNQLQLGSPSLRATSLLDIVNWNANGVVAAAAQIPDNNAPMADFKESPIELTPGEGMYLLSAVDVAAAAENVIAVVFLTDGTLAVPLEGRIETIIFDAQAPAVANVWTTTATLPRQQLRAGTYAVVGMKAVGISMVAARIIFGNQGARPGVPGTNAAAGAGGVGSFSDAVDQFHGLFRYGRLGIWGTFSHTNPPQMQVLSSLADAAIAQHFALDVIRIGP